jgi:Ca-activated chloride channel family protein
MSQLMFFQSRRPILGLSLLMALGFLSANASHSLQQPPDPNVVKIVFSPLDRNGKIIPLLTKGDIRVYDDGMPQTIRSFERLTDQRISAVLLVDNSLSQQHLAQTAKLTSRAFVEKVIRTGTDQAAVVGFSGKPTVEQDLTTDRDHVFQAIDRLEFVTSASLVAGAILSKGPGPELQEKAASAIWDSLWSASESLTVASTWDSRRIIFLLSDGEDTFSYRSIAQAIEQAQRNDVAIYAIGMGDKRYTPVREGTLKKIAAETGGRAFFPKQIAELETIFSQLSEELHSPYLIKYMRKNRKPSGEIQKLKIQLSKRGSREILLDYRRGYVSP